MRTPSLVLSELQHLHVHLRVILYEILHAILYALLATSPLFNFLHAETFRKLALTFYIASLLFRALRMAPSTSGYCVLGSICGVDMAHSSYKLQKRLPSLARVACKT